MSFLFLSVSGCTDDHQSKKIDATATDSLQYNRRQFAEYLSSYPAIPDSAQFMAALRDTFHLAIYEYPTRKEDEKITIYQKVKLFGSPKEYFLIEYDWGVGSTGSYPWKYQLLINEEGRSMGTVSAEQVRLVNVFPEQNPFLLARLVNGKGNGGHHLYSIKADTLENVYEGYYDYTLKTYDRHMDMAVFNPAELNIRFADNNQDGFNDIIFYRRKTYAGWLHQRFFVV